MTERQKKRRQALTRVTLVFALAGIAWGGYWFAVTRHQESTDDAYVAGNQIPISAQTGGTVTAVLVDDTDRVKAGAPLLQLDRSDAELALERARAELALAVRQSRQQITGTQRAEAQVKLRQSELERARGDLARRTQAAGNDAVGKEELQHARDAVSAAEAALAAAQQELKAGREMVLADAVERQPAVARAAAQLRESWLALQRTTVLAPADGQIARRSVQLGARVAPGAPLMALVPPTMWVDANFKEVQLARLRIGQPAEIEADVYGSKVSYHGKVVGLAAGTGSAFSLLPPQNATGNWIKVVQRVPVRIALDARELAQHPLRLGLSLNVSVDTRDQSGPVLAPQGQPRHSQRTTVYDAQRQGAERLISDIIAANAGMRQP